MGARKLKKKPVLVVDPEELAQAYQMFQQGAAEQLDEYEPEQRPRASVSLFGLAPMSDEDRDDRYAQRLSPLNDDDEIEDEVPEAEAPAPEQVLGLTRPREPTAPRANIFGTLPDALAKEPAEPLIARNPSPRTPEPIVERATPPVSATEAPAARPRLVRNYDDIAPGFSHRDPVRSAPLPPAPTHAQPADPRRADLQPARVTIAELTDEPDFDDGVASVIVFDEDEAVRPAPEPLAPPPSEQSRLRARIVREDVCLTQPEPSRWQRFVTLLQRWYAALTRR